MTKNRSTHIGQMAFSIIALAIPATIVLGAAAQPADTAKETVPSTAPAAVLVLSSSDFWSNLGSSAGDHQKDMPSQAELQRIAAGHDKAAIRLRAWKLLCDLAGHTHLQADLSGEEPQRVTAVAFTWLEGHLSDAEVAKYSPQSGFAHLTLSVRPGDDAVWVLLETVQLPPGFNGGLNFRYDRKTNAISSCDRWGEIRKAK